MNAVFKACLLSMVLLIVLSPLVQADNLPAPLMNDPKFSFLSTREGDNIVLRYNVDKVSGIPGILTTVNSVNDEIDWLFGDNPYRTTIAIAGDNAEFRLYANVGDAPDTAKALNWNTGYNGLVIIKSPATLSDFKQVLKHQMARIAVRTRLTYYKSLPEWYQDGMASYVAGDITQDQRFAATTMAATGTWMSLGELERVYKNMTIYNFDEQNYSNARAEAATLVDYIGNLYGARTMVTIIDNYSTSGNLDQTFLNETTFTPETLNTVFKNSISGSNNNNSTPIDKSDNGTVEGYLQYIDGKPAPGATLTLSGTSGTRNATTGNDGHYTVTVAPGIYQIILPGGVTGSQFKVETGKSVSKNMTITSPPVKEDSAAWSLPSTGDILLYGSIAIVNVIGIIAVLIILRRNWH
jgi:hypothetical protein